MFGLRHWIREYFGEPSIDQIIYHLHYGTGLLSTASELYLVTFAVECVAAPLALALLAVAVERAVPPRLTQDVTAGLSAIALRQGRRWLPTLAFSVAVSLLLVQLSAPAYALSRLGRDFFSKHYIPPASAKLTQHRLKNLVLIYVEGLDSSYGDPSLFGRDLLQPLKSLGALSFKYRPAPGTQWTMGGIVGTQCGIPLKVMSLFDSSKAASELRTFLPQAHCLGDLLGSFGYRNVFMGGARLSFAAKGTFLQDHGYAERYGKKQWLQQGVDIGHMSDWGLYDDDLFDRAKVKLKELHDAGGRFNLTLLTLDTHHPLGFVSNRCRQNGVADFEGVVECTAHQVADFVEFARAGGMLANTNIVIIGDHLAMPNPAYRKLQSASERTIFNAFISDDAHQAVVDELLPYDLFPTIVQFCGIEVADGRLGLGYGAFSPPWAPKRNAPDREALFLNVLNPSEVYANLWRPWPAASSALPAAP